MSSGESGRGRVRSGELTGGFKRICPHEAPYLVTRTSLVFMDRVLSFSNEDRDSQNNDTVCDILEKR